MTELQKTIIDKVNRLSDNDIQILMLIIDRLLPANETKTCQLDQKLQAFNNLQASVNRIKNYLPSDYDPEGEYREAMELKFSSEAFYSQFAQLKRLHPAPAKFRDGDFFFIETYYRHIKKTPSHYLLGQGMEFFVVHMVVYYSNKISIENFKEYLQ